MIRNFEESLEPIVYKEETEAFLMNDVIPVKREVASTAEIFVLLN